MYRTPDAYLIIPYEDVTFSRVPIEAFMEAQEKARESSREDAKEKAKWVEVKPKEAITWKEIKPTSSLESE